MKKKLAYVCRRPSDRLEMCSVLYYEDCPEQFDGWTKNGASGISRPTEDFIFKNEAIIDLDDDWQNWVEKWGHKSGICFITL